MVNEEKIGELLLKICINKEIFSFEKLKEIGFSKISPKGSIFLSENENALLFELIEELKRDEYIRDNFSSDFLRDMILEIVIASSKYDNFELQKFIEKEIEAFYQNLKKHISEHLFIYPVENLHLKRKIKIGNILFYPYTKSYKKYIRSKIWAIFKNNSYYSRKQKFSYLNMALENFENSLKNVQFSLAEVSLYGCEGPVEQVALRKIRMAIYALKLYSLPNDDSNLSYFGIAGEIVRGFSRSNFEFVKGKASQMNKRVGYVIPFELNPKRKEMMSKFDFRLLNKIVAKNAYNGFEQRLLTAIFWFGYAMNIQIFYDEIKKHQRPKNGYENIEYFNLNQRFFYLFVALESLLKIQNEQQNKVKYRVSRLIGNNIDEKMRDYFKKRGEIAHQGVEFVSLEQVIELTLIVQYCIFRTLKILKNKKFQEHSQFIQFVDELTIA